MSDQQMARGQIADVIVEAAARALGEWKAQDWGWGNSDERKEALRSMARAALEAANLRAVEVNAELVFALRHLTARLMPMVSDDDPAIALALAALDAARTALALAQGGRGG